jgi:beta-fructofuranosidase
MVVHEINQRLDGTLDVRIPDAVKRHFAVQQPVVYDQTFGVQLPEGGVVRLDGSGSFRCVSGGLLPEMAMIEATATFAESTKGFGVMLRTSQDFENAYYVRVEPLRGRLVFDSWPRRGDVPYMIEVERPLAVEPGKPVQFVIYVDGTLCEVYVNDQVAMSVRMYDHLVGNWGLFVSEGGVTFSDVRLSTPA